MSTTTRTGISNALAGAGVLFLVLAGAVSADWYAAISLFLGMTCLVASHVLTPCQDQITKWWRERLKNHGLLMLGLVVLSAAALAEPRPRFGGVSSVRIANYNAPSVLFETRDQVRPVVDELNELRRKDWKRGDAKVSCYSTVLLMSGKKKTGELRVTADTVVERPVDKGQAAHHVAIDAADIPILRKHLAEILPAKDCQ